MPPLSPGLRIVCQRAARAVPGLLALALIAAAFYAVWSAVGLVIALGVPSLITSLAIATPGLLIGLMILTRRDARRTADRRQMGLCECCGYDLRASHDRCPECNAPLPVDLARRRRMAQDLRPVRRPDHPPGDTPRSAGNLSPLPRPSPPSPTGLPSSSPPA